MDYIVQNTVGKLCEGKTPKQIENLRVLDPACGSGSFLLGAYQYLLDHHLQWYTDNPAKRPKRKPAVYEGRGGQWLLTTAEKKRILTNNIYGVDIDPQAVEVTKLSLLLRVLENESQDSLESQLKLFGERALPNLVDNIKCGNSLIAPDFYQGSQGGLFDEEEHHRINAFDWKAEFPEIMKGGGFDAVIGNPPYVFGRDWNALNISDDVKKYLGHNYKSSPYQLDMFSIFMEKAMSICKSSGRTGQIVPNVWLTNTYSSTTRNFILRNSKDLKIVTPPPDVFPGLTVDTAVYSLQKTKKPGDSFEIYSLRNGGIDRVSICDTKLYLDGERPISTQLNTVTAELIFRIKEDCSKLGQFAEITRGVHSYRTGRYGQTAFGKGPQTERDVRERPHHSQTPDIGYRPFILGRDLKRFTPPTGSEYVDYGVWLAEPRNPKFFNGERVYSRKILGERLIVTLEKENSVADQQVYITLPKANSVSAPFLCGILGSKLTAFYIRMFYDEINDAFPQIKVGQLRSLPIPPVDNQKSKDFHDHMASLVETMLDLHKKLPDARTPQEKTLIERQIEAADRGIDALVYELYGLTDEEIQIVEEASGK